MYSWLSARKCTRCQQQVHVSGITLLQQKSPVLNLWYQLTQNTGSCNSHRMFVIVIASLEYSILLLPVLNLLAHMDNFLWVWFFFIGLCWIFRHFLQNATFVRISEMSNLMSNFVSYIRIHDSLTVTECAHCERVHCWRTLVNKIELWWKCAHCSTFIVKNVQKKWSMWHHLRTF